MNERAPLTARVNLLRTTREGLRERLRAEGVEARETPLSPLGLFLDTHQNAFALPSFQEGLFELQDEGSQLLGLLVDAPPTRVVDACAGAGGKTLQLAGQMRNRGELFALDVDARRLEELKRRARRAGVHNVRIRAIPPSGPEATAALTDLGEKADRVLVDAPCSGTGTFRRKPDGRYRLAEAMLAQHVERQRALLAQFAALVRPGGRLIYGTCSVLEEENEAVVAWFLERHPEFRAVPPADRLGPELGAKVTTGDFLRLSPALHGTDGFFGAILLRER
jgi:16S rRNA (cytosine967-C5)-methyltransferase